MKRRHDGFQELVVLQLWVMTMGLRRLTRDDLGGGHVQGQLWFPGCLKDERLVTATQRSNAGISGGA